MQNIKAGMMKRLRNSRLLNTLVRKVADSVMRWDPALMLRPSLEAKWLCLLRMSP